MLGELTLGRSRARRTELPERSPGSLVSSRIAGEHMRRKTHGTGFQRKDVGYNCHNTAQEQNAEAGVSSRSGSRNAWWTSYMK